MDRLLLILLLPLIAITALGSLLVGESPRSTLSATAWRKRDHKYWGWTHRAINALFFWQANHCRGAHAAEGEHGSVWAAWLAKFKEASK
jgi:hypothetical protein